MVTSKIIFSEKSLSVRMSVCLSVCPSPKQKILLNKVVRYNSRVSKNTAVTSKIIFSEKSLSVHMSVRLSRPRPRHVPVPVTSPQKVAETENFEKQSCQIHFKGCYCRRRRRRCCIAGRGKAKPRIYNTI